MAAIVARGIEKRYGDVTALGGLDLEVDRGELFGLLGPNGAGKTTAIEVFTGQLRPDAGEAEVLGVDPVQDPVGVRRRVGVLPEQERPPSFMSPGEYFAFVGDVRGMDGDEVEARVDEWARRLGFRAQMGTLCTDLSRGQQQKVMITQAFLHEPDVVFIDEPVANLDPLVQEEVKRFLVGYAEAGNAVFLSTHQAGVAEEVCTRVGILSEGRLAADRAVDELETSLLDAFVEVVEAEAAAAGGGGR